MDSPDLFSTAAQSVAARLSPEASAPFPPFAHCRTAASLEYRGWHRETAGEEDFLAAVGAFPECLRFPRMGVLVQGRCGTGKTALVRAFTRRTKLETVFLPLETEYARLNASDYPYFVDGLLNGHVVLDDLGAEPRYFDRELAAEFISRYHRLGKGRLFITTNLTGKQLVERYTMRICSRLKDLCVRLQLKGRDKRKWVKPAQPEGGAA